MGGLISDVVWKSGKRSRSRGLEQVLTPIMWMCDDGHQVMRPEGTSPLSLRGTVQILPSSHASVQNEEGEWVLRGRLR